jgi:Uma2 family endonuclease
MAVKQKLSVAQYLALPEEKPYLEYVCGEVLQKAMPNKDHMQIVNRSGLRVTLYDDAHAGGHCGPEPRVRFATELGDEYRLPDYAYWAPRKPFDDGKEMLPPTLAIEVRSPDESMTDQREKCRYYRRYGVDVAWLFDPRTRTVEVFDAEHDGAAATCALRSPLLPGFELDAAALFTEAMGAVEA